MVPRTPHRSPREEPPWGRETRESAVKSPETRGPP